MRIIAVTVSRVMWIRLKTFDVALFRYHLLHSDHLSSGRHKLSSTNSDDWPSRVSESFKHNQRLLKRTKYTRINVIDRRSREKFNKRSIFDDLYIIILCKIMDLSMTKQNIVGLTILLTKISIEQLGQKIISKCIIIQGRC